MSAAYRGLALESLAGLWRRSLIVYPDGRRDTTTEVRWLQGVTLYADIRQPVSHVDFGSVECLNDLSHEDCLQLAAQEAFAGRLGFDGRHFEWARWIDFQPASASADAGSLEWHGEVLVERGRDVNYLEHWHRDAAATQPCGALELRASGSEVKALFLRVGALFMFARGRTLALPPGRSLRECVADAADVHSARRLIDCEISFGTVDNFRITASTLPFRRGGSWDARLGDDRIMICERSAAGAPHTRAWDIVKREGVCAVL